MNSRVMVGLVGCEVAAKTAIPAKKLCKKLVHKKCLAFSRLECAHIFLISPLYGLLSLEEPVTPMDKTRTCKGDQHTLAIQVVRDLISSMRVRVGTSPFQVILLSNGAFGTYVCQECKWNGIPVCWPVKDMSNREQVRVLSMHIRAKKATNT